MSTTAPSGAVHEVGVDEIFFSTTDAKGIIERSNDVFVRLSHFERDELAGAPHNLIRHPEMPGGAFHAMWATLKAGSPFAAYVRNLAANGSEYDVFATVTPLRSGGYLSVRTRPVCTDLFQTACAIYDDARSVEDQAIKDGANRRQAAQVGAERILEMLAEAGIPSYETFQNLALPQEVTSREELSAGLPSRPRAEGPLATMLAEATDINTGLDAWMRQQDELADLGNQLGQAGKRLSRAIESPSLTAQALEGLDRSDSRVGALAELLDLWLQMQEIVSQQVGQLQEALAQMTQVIGRTRFRIALARLHSTITTTFIVKLIDHDTDNQLSRGAIRDLLDALEDGMAELEEQVLEHQRLTEATTTAIAQSQRILAIPRQLLMLWTTDPQSSDPTLPETVKTLSRAADHAVSTSGTTLENLGELAARCRELDVVEPSREMREHLRRMRRAYEQTHGEQTSE